MLDSILKGAKVSKYIKWLEDKIATAPESAGDAGVPSDYLRSLADENTLHIVAGLYADEHPTFKSSGKNGLVNLMYVLVLG